MRLTKTVSRLVILAGLLAVPPASLPAQQPGGSERNVSSDTLPGNFRGRITYQGTHEAVLDRGARRGSRQYGGALTVELTFDGNSVKGRFSGTGGINSGTMSGTRSGSRCRLFEERAGDVIEGECTRTRFSAEARSQGSRNAMAAAFEARATQFAEGLAPPPSAPRQAAALGNKGMSRCWALGFAAPQSQADLDRLSTSELLKRGQGLSIDWYCSGLYFGAAAQRGDIQGMAAYGYGFGADSPTPDPELQAYWCQRAYRTARRTGTRPELDAVNHFCPINVIASLMTPAERRANQASIDRAGRVSAQVRAEVEARARSVWNDVLGTASPANSDNHPLCTAPGGDLTTQRPC